MLDEMNKRILALEKEVELLNKKTFALLAVCLQQASEIDQMADALEEVVVVVDNPQDDMMASLASEIQKARKSPLN